jgi:hypothetical protein
VKLSIPEHLDRIKDEYQYLHQQLQTQRVEIEKLSQEKVSLFFISLFFNPMSLLSPIAVRPSTTPPVSMFAFPAVDTAQFDLLIRVTLG